MLLYKYMPDCCDQCCDYEKADPQKDRVLVNRKVFAKEIHSKQIHSKVFAKDAQIAPTAPEDKVFAKEPVFGKEIATPTAVRGKPVQVIDEAHELMRLREARVKQVQEAHEHCIGNKLLQQRQDEEAREMQKAHDIADAVAAQEVVEAQELSEAFEASLRDYEEKAQKIKQRVRASADAERYEQECKQRRKEEQEDQQKIDVFLKKNKFQDIHVCRKTSTMFNFTKAFYPLHCAVTQNDAEMVQLLLAAGASPLAKNSSGFTPLAQAQVLDKRGSHAQILKLLRFGVES